MASKTYHVIQPDGKVATAEWQMKLEYSCPRFEDIRQALGFEPDETLEHVSVLWKGKLAHMFGLPTNPKATRVYWNSTLNRNGRGSLLYNDLAAEWRLNKTVDLLFIEALQLADAVIVGPAFLWEGEME